MSKHISIFQAVDGVPDIYCATNGSLKCTAIRLKNGNFCLYSPVTGLNDASLSSLRALDGDVEFVFAPNHYHNKALREYMAAFPKATLVCSQNAKPRLEKITKLKFSNLDRLIGALPPHMKLHEPQGLKTGEIWVQLTTNEDIIWIVTDAFGGAKAPAGTYVAEPQLLGTFPKFGVQDKALYRQWVDAHIAIAAPTIIIPCHHAPFKGHNLADDISALHEEYFS